MSGIRTFAQRLAARAPAGPLVVALFGVLLIGGEWYLTNEKIRIDLEGDQASEVRRNEILVLAHEEQVIRLLREIDQLLLLIKSQYERHDTTINLANLYADGIINADSFSFIGAFDERGDLIASGQTSLPLHIADRDYFIDHRKSDSRLLRIGAPLQGRNSGRWNIPLSRRFNKPDGSFGGLVVVSIVPAHFTSLFAKSDLGPKDVLALVRTDGIVLARRRGETTSFGEDISKSDVMTAAAVSPADSFVGTGSLDHTRKFFSYRKLQDYPVLVAVGTAEESALAPFRGREQRALREAWLATGLIAAFCALIIALMLRQKRANAHIHDQLTLIDQARDAIVVRGIDNRIQSWNKGAERVYGWTAAEAIGQPADQLLHTDPQKFREATKVVLSTGEWIGEVTHQHRDGHAVTVDDHWSLLNDDRGRPRAIMAIKTDISERRAMESRLRQSQHLEAVGQLTGGVAHDFNNLLTVMLGNADILAHKLSGQPELRKMAEMIVTAASRGAELTSRLLAFARRQTLDPKAVDPNKLLTGMHELLRRTLPENIDIELALGTRIWLALIDPGQLEGAILNLCLNARDAMPEGGRLTIETTNTEIEPDFVEQGNEIEPGPYVLITVSDTGTGIPPEYLSRVFEPFFTTKEFGKGTGLGLSMVYGFVKQSRGHVRIYSEVGKGTAIKMFLPRAGIAESRIEQVPADAAGLTGTETILLVEDDALVRDHARDQLAELGYRVIAAENGAHALELLRDHPDIDLLFTDVVMPGGLNGRELAEQALLLRPGLRVLYTSGYTENSNIQQGRLGSGMQLLDKPYRAIDLARKVRAVLSRPAG